MTKPGAENPNAVVTQTQIEEIGRLAKETDLTINEIVEKINDPNIDSKHVRRYAYRALGLPPGKKFQDYSAGAAITKRIKNRFPALKGKAPIRTSAYNIIKQNPEFLEAIKQDFDDGMYHKDIEAKYTTKNPLTPKALGTVGLSRSNLEDLIAKEGWTRRNIKAEKMRVPEDEMLRRATIVREVYADPTITREQAAKNLKKKGLDWDRTAVYTFKKNFEERFPDEPPLFEERGSKIKVITPGSRKNTPRYKRHTQDLMKLQALLKRKGNQSFTNDPQALARLIKESGLNDVTFQGRTDTLRKIYKGDKRPGFKIDPAVKNKMHLFPISTRLTENVLLDAGFSMDEINKAVKVRNSIAQLGKDMGGKSNFLVQMEHKIPKNILQSLRGSGLSEKQYKNFVGRIQPVTSYLNMWKAQFDRRLEGALNTYLKSGMTQTDLDAFNRLQNQLIKQAKEISGGYDIGKVKVDLKGNVEILSPDELFTAKVKGVGGGSRAVIDYFKNLEYHNKLADNFKNNPGLEMEFTDMDGVKTRENAFGRLEAYLAKTGKTEIPRIDDTITKEIKNLSTHKDFMKYFKSNPNSPLLKGIERGVWDSLSKAAQRNVKIGGALGIATLLIHGTSKDKGLTTQEMLERRGPGTVVDDQVTEVAQAGTTDQMTYNATTGEFVDAEGEPETQEGILNWIADHPIYSGLAPIPIGMGAGLGAEAMNAKNVGKFFTSMKFMLPPAYAAEKLYQYKEGWDMGEMFANPLDAVWAMALDSPKSAKDKLAYYTQQAQKAAGRSWVALTPAQRAAATEAQKLGLRHLDPRRAKETWGALKRGAASPRSFGTSLVFPFAGPDASKNRAMKMLRGVGRFAPFGPLPMALLGASMAWDKYKFNEKVGDHVDGLRARGVISEADADTMGTIYKQGWLGTTALGAKLLGSEELMFEGQLRDLDYQKMMLDEMKDWYEGREKKATDLRAGERQEDFFSWFSKGGRVGVAEGGDDFKPRGGMTRRTFLKWLVGSIAAGVAAVTGKGVKQAAKTATTTATKSIPTKFAGVEGMPAWFPRAVYQIKTHGKLIELADKDYVHGDMYEMMIPVTRKYMDAHAKRKGGENVYITKNEYEKVIMEENPLTGEISMHWTGTDNFGDDAIRQINFKPGSAGYQKFGVDPEHPQAWEYQRVKVEDPEFTYTQPDQSQPYRDDIEYLDIFQEGDEVVSGLEKMTGHKNVVTKDDTVMDLTDYSKADKEVDEAFEKKIYRDLPEDEALLPDPEGSIGPEGDWLGDSPNEMIGGDVPDWLPKDEWPKKAEGGIIETGNIARRPGAVPPLSGPDPEGIMTLYSNPKQVKVG